MLYPLSAFRSLGLVLLALIIVVQLNDDLGPKRGCQVEAFKLVEFFNRMFNKNQDSDFVDADEDDVMDSGRWPSRPETSTNSYGRRRSGSDNEITTSYPWRIFDFGIRGRAGKAAIVKRHAPNNGGKRQWRTEEEVDESKGSDRARKPEVSNDDNEMDVRKLKKTGGHKDKAKQRDETEKSRQHDKKKMDRKSDDRDDKPSKKWHKPSGKEKFDDEDENKRAKHKSNKNMKASRRGDDEEEFELIEEQPAEKPNRPKPTRKLKPWFWSRRSKSPDDEPVEETFFQKRLNKRIGDIESFKRMIYCKFSPNAPECARNETSTNTIDFFGKFKKFTKKPKNKTTTPAANNTTTPASTTGFTEGSTTEWSRATTGSFDEGRFATNGTTMPIPTRGNNNPTTTAQPTTTNTATTGGGETTTPQPTTTTGASTTGASTTQGSTTTTGPTTTSAGSTTTGQPTTTGAPTTTGSPTTTVTNQAVTNSPVTQPPAVRFIPPIPQQNVSAPIQPAPKAQPLTLLP